MTSEHADLRIAFSSAICIVLAILGSGCAANPLPEEFEVSRFSINSGEIRSCRNVEGVYFYDGDLVHSEQGSFDPTIGKVFFHSQVPTELAPGLIRVSATHLSQNRFSLVIMVTPKDDVNRVVLAMSTVAWCHNGSIRIVDQAKGSADGTLYTSWEVRELTKDVSGDLLILYAYSWRGLFTGTDYARVAMRFRHANNQ